MANITIEIQTSALSFKSWLNTSYIGVSLAAADGGGVLLKETELGIDQEGIFKSLLSEASREVLKIFLSRQGDIQSSASVAQIDTVTVTGTSGGADVEIASQGGFEIIFAGSLGASIDAFVTDNATEILALGVVVTSDSVDKLIFTANVAGVPFSSPVVTNNSGDLAGTTVHTQPNVSSTPPFEYDNDSIIYRFAEAEPVLPQSLAIQDSLKEDVENAIYIYITAMWMKSKGHDDFLQFLLSKYNKLTDSIDVHLYKLHD